MGSVGSSAPSRSVTGPSGHLLGDTLVLHSEGSLSPRDCRSCLGTTGVCPVPSTSWRAVVTTEWGRSPAPSFGIAHGGHSSTVGRARGAVRAPACSVRPSSDTRTSFPPPPVSLSSPHPRVCPGSSRGRIREVRTNARQFPVGKEVGPAPPLLPRTSVHLGPSDPPKKDLSAGCGWTPPSCLSDTGRGLRGTGGLDVVTRSTLVPLRSLPHPTSVVDSRDPVQRSVVSVQT